MVRLGTALFLCWLNCAVISDSAVSICSTLRSVSMTVALYTVVTLTINSDNHFSESFQHCQLIQNDYNDSANGTSSYA